MLPFKFFTGAIIGSGQQWLPWIHLEDLLGIIQYLLEDTLAEGPFNLTAPNPVRFSTFVKTLARVIHRPAWIRVPGFFITVMYGEMGKETILASQRVISSRIDPEEYTFLFEKAEDALMDLLKND